MGAECDLSDLPSDYSKEVISDIVNKGNFASFQIDISPGSEVGDNYIGKIIRIKITGVKANGFQESIHLIMKMSPFEDDLRTLIPVNSLYNREVYAYNVLLPHFNKLQDKYRIPLKDRFKSAKCYKASAENCKELIVMEDLRVKGFKMYDRLKPFDYAHLKMSIENIASIHAFSFVTKAQDPKLFEEMASHASNAIDFGDNFDYLIEKCFKEALKNMDDDICKERLKIFSIGHYEKLEKLLAPEMGAPYNVICHGDCWSNNALFKYEGDTPVDMRSLDWQIIRNTSPVTDLAYMIFLSTDQTMREKHFTGILDLYYDTLRARLAAMDHKIDDCYPESVYRDHLKTILPYGLIMSVLALPFILSERGNAPDIVDMLRKDSDIAETRAQSQICIERMRGVIKDFVKYDLI